MEQILFFIILVLILLFIPRIIKDPKIGLLFLLFSLPFERIGAIDIFGMTLRVSQVLVIILGAIYVWRFIKKGNISIMNEIKKDPFWMPLFLYILAAFVSIGVAVNLKRAISVFIFISFVIFTYELVIRLFDNKKILEKVEKVLFWTTFGVAIFGIYQFIGDIVGLPNWVTGLRYEYTKIVFGFPRIQSTALEPLYFANFLLIPLGLFSSLFLNRAELKLEKVDKKYLLLLLLIGINIVLSLSRGAFFASAIIIATVIIFTIRKIKWHRLLSYFGIVILAIIISLGAVKLTTTNSKKDNAKTFIKHSTEITDGGSYNQRARGISFGIEAFKSSPIIGIGIGNFGPWRANYPEETPSTGWDIPNNEIVEIAAETGSLGLLAFITFILLLFIRSIKAILKSNGFQRAFTLGLFSVVLGFVVQYQAFSTLYIMHVWVTLGLLVGLQNLIFSENNYPLNE